LLQPQVSLVGGFMADDLDAAEAAAEAAAESAFETALSERERAVDALLRGGKAVEAARRALDAPPFASKAPATKERSAAAVARALTALAARGDGETKELLDALDAAAADALMKYLYRALARPEAAGALLKLHGQLVERHGVGCIVRAIVDRKTA
jgi:actin related protein 2/3 complex subunit 5